MVFQKCANKMSSRSVVSSEARLGKDLLPSFCGCWEDSGPCRPLVRGNHNSLPPVPLHIAAHFIKDSKEDRESQLVRQKYNLCNIIIEEASRHLHCIPLVRRKSQVPPILKERELQKNMNTGAIWGHLRVCCKMVIFYF